VRLFTIEMLLVYLLFATPDAEARAVRYDPARHKLVGIIESLDWLRRFAFEKKKGAAFVVVDRGGAEKRGLGAATTVVGALPALFVLWPLVAAADAALRRARRGKAA
jgi:hypothetical protein